MLPEIIFFGQIQDNLYIVPRQETNPFRKGKPQLHTLIIYNSVQRLHLLKKYGSVFHKNHLASNLDAWTHLLSCLIHGGWSR